MLLTTLVMILGVTSFPNPDISNHIFILRRLRITKGVKNGTPKTWECMTLRMAAFIDA